MIWTGPNDAPLSTKEERMAELRMHIVEFVGGPVDGQQRELFCPPPEKIDVPVKDKTGGFGRVTYSRGRTSGGIVFYTTTAPIPSPNT
jgi:hypothetical protein